MKIIDKILTLLFILIIRLSCIIVVSSIMAHIVVDVCSLIVKGNTIMNTLVFIGTLSISILICETFELFYRFLSRKLLEDNEL